jgi:hypothetical protein
MTVFWFFCLLLMKSDANAFARLSRKLNDFVAHAVAHRIKLLICVAIAIGVLAVLTIFLRRNLDSDYLNLLPQQFESVQGLKIMNSQFADSRQVVFGFLGESGHGDDVDAFRTHFMTELAKQPWVVRVMYQAPIESQQGIDEIQGVIPSLLLNLPESNSGSLRFGTPSTKTFLSRPRWRLRWIRWDCSLGRCDLLPRIPR